MSMIRSRSDRGFTIVELLIVIVVIAILAAVSIVAYTGIQGRARDAQRMQDMATITKALELYKVSNGEYPPTPSSTPSAGGWHLTSDGTSATNFLSTLISPNNGVTSVPVDPYNHAVNTGGTSLAPSRNGDNFVYFYYRYAAGEWTCDSSKGRFYVLGVTRMDTVTKGQNASNNPGFACLNGSGGRDWSPFGAWVTGKFTN